ncbi:methyl-CpG-binding domain-containing protein 5 [Malania oleifera]|uniref:methyl-CpG-binding domain-containing protein 5 n=1 Tax=Malania oleifera TaxID=397392 RepID=UPI0025AE2B42|nr:methyl-CpG-binding domain-containing protein 5 [Malania oleifera]
MSVFETSAGRRNPASDSPESGSVSDVPPDPLLKSGTFIDATVAIGGTLVGAPGVPGESDPPHLRRSSHNGTAATVSGSSNCTDVARTPSPVRMTEPTESPMEPQSRSKRKRGSDQATAATSSETPSWLPPGWTVEDRVRSSGATAGLVDKYYVDPVSGYRFRSKKEVFYFLENGTKRKKKLKEGPDVDTPSQDTPSTHKKKGSGSKGKKRKVALNFDFANVPAKVRWVLGDASEGSWTPFIGDADERVPESSKLEWAAAFESVASKGRSDGSMF